MKSSIFQIIHKESQNKMISAQDLYPVPTKITKIYSYLFLKTLSESKGKIKLAIDTNTCKYYIFKIFDNSRFTSQLLFNNEKQVTEKLDHPNIVKLHEIFYNESYIQKNGNTCNFNALVLEYAPYKDLFFYIRVKGAFGEKISRTIFIKILHGLDHIHKKGYAHMDLKPENIFLDENFEIKVGDFDLAQKLDSKELKVNSGTTFYMPPEYFQNKIKDGIKFDIFSVGVILFVMLFGHPPFQNSDSTNLCYRLLKDKKYNQFWSMHEKKGIRASESLKILLIQIFDPNPEVRLKIEEILNSEWCNGPLADNEDVGKEIENRLSAVK